MTHDELNRRKFNRLAAAALGGMAAGATWGCSSQNQTAPAPSGSAAPDNAPGASGGDATGGDAANGEADRGGALSVSDKHLCRGLNDCKGQGAGGENACRGQGQCATYEHHACGGENACKGQGGCGETVAENACKGQGNCHVPLMEDAWQKVRARKEQAWTTAQEEFSAAPPAKE